jgi:hypothetical protein
MTISPPAKVNLGDGEPVRVLASGIDTVYLAIDVTWPDETFFQLLAKLKAQARADEADVPVELPCGASEGWPLNVRPFGCQGYEWLLTGRAVNLRVGHWLKPHSRPSIMAEIGSETLWHSGFDEAVFDVCLLLRGALGCRLESIRVSRADLCVDALLRAEWWGPSLLELAVTRARAKSMHWQDGCMTGVSIGKGAIRARLYDKALEIVTSGKGWMYDVWGLEGVPDGWRVIRTEFQLRREVVKSLGVGGVDELSQRGSDVWRYCTESWLKFQTGGPQHTQRKTLPWWGTVQGGYGSAQPGEPAVRHKAVAWDKRQLMAQTRGTLLSLASMQIAGSGRVSADAVDRALGRVLNDAREAVLGSQTLEEDVRRRWARYRRAAVEDATGEAGRNECSGEEVIELGPDDPCPF